MQWSVNSRMNSRTIYIFAEFVITLKQKCYFFIFCKFSALPVSEIA